MRTPHLRGDGWNARTLLAGLLLVAGAGFAGYGGYAHRSTAVQVSAGRCDACTPWHPLLVVAPLVVGAVLLLAGGYLLSRR